LRNSDYWRFESDANEPDASGSWVEVPIYTEMVPAWRMATSKRMKFSAGGGSSRTLLQKLNRIRDLARFRYPLKFDFCRMTLHELISMIEKIVERDQSQPDAYRPIVAIGHTKDLVDPQTVDDFLGFLREKEIAIGTFESASSKLLAPKNQRTAPAAIHVQ
jgi:hypothetical protein